MVSNIINEARKRGVDLGGFNTATDGLNAFNPRRSDIPVLVDALRGIVKALKTDSGGTVDFDKYLSHIAGYGIAVAKEDGNNGETAQIATSSRAGIAPAGGGNVTGRNGEVSTGEQGNRSGLQTADQGEKSKAEFYKKNAVTPKQGSIAEALVEKAQREYGIKCYIVSGSAWGGSDSSVSSSSAGGEMFARETLTQEDLDLALPHEATHIMRQTDFAPYFEFAGKTADYIDFSADSGKRLVYMSWAHVVEQDKNAALLDIKDVLEGTVEDAENWQNRFFDELNATVYSYTRIGQTTGMAADGAELDFHDAFFDLDSYFSELDAIHEQFKNDRNGGITGTQGGTDSGGGNGAGKPKPDGGFAGALFPESERAEAHAAKYYEAVRGMRNENTDREVRDYGTEKVVHTRRKESNRDFRERCRNAGYRIAQAGEVTYAYKPANDRGANFWAKQAHDEFKRLGIESFIYSHLEVNSDGVTVVSNGDAHTIGSMVVGINARTGVEGFETVGHEVYHVLDGIDPARKAVFTQVLKDGINYKSDKFALLVDTVLDAYSESIDQDIVQNRSESLTKEVRIALDKARSIEIEEEIFSYMTGFLYGYGHQSFVKEMLSDYDGVIAALDKLMDWLASRNDGNNSRLSMKSPDETPTSKYYEAVRRMRTDVARIASHTRYSERVISEIKEYVFLQEHDFDDGVRGRFAPSFEMAQSWRRLIEGKHVKAHDLTLLRHVRLERRLVLEGKTLAQAHKEASKRYNYAKEARAYYDQIDRHKKDR